MTMPAGPSADDRVMAMIRAIVRQEVARLTFLASWEFVVSAVVEGPPVLVDCQSTTADLPDIPRVVLRPSSAGSYAVPAVGSKVLVRFVNGDPSRPYVDALDPAAPPTKVWVGGPGSPVGRVGDEVTITVAEFAVAGLIATNPAVGHVTSGSGKVRSG